MRIKKGLLVLAAVTLPLGSVALMASSASAGKFTGTGHETCGFAGTISFSPPLSKNGTAGVKKTVTTVNTTLTGCHGGTPSAPGTSAIKPIKAKVPSGMNASTCSGFATAGKTTVVKGKINWSGGKPSKFTVNGLSFVANGMGEVGFHATFPVTGSYAGTGSLTVFLTAADSNKIATCSGSIASVHIDGSTSSATF